MTKKNNLQLLLIQTPKDIRNVVLSFVSLEGDKYDKMCEKNTKLRGRYYKVLNKRSRHWDNMKAKIKQIKRLKRRRREMIEKFDKDIEDCERIRDNYIKHREALEYPLEQVEDKYLEYDDKNNYEKLEQKFKKYKQFRPYDRANDSDNTIFDREFQFWIETDSEEEETESDEE